MNIINGLKKRIITGNGRDEKNGLSADSIATVDVDNLGSNISLLRLKLRLGLR